MKCLTQYELDVRQNVANDARKTTKFQDILNDNLTSKDISFGSSTAGKRLQLHENWRRFAEVRDVCEDLLASLGKG